MTQAGKAWLHSSNEVLERYHTCHWSRRGTTIGAAGPWAIPVEGGGQIRCPERRAHWLARGGAGVRASRRVGRRDDRSMESWAMMVIVIIATESSSVITSIPGGMGYHRSIPPSEGDRTRGRDGDGHVSSRSRYQSRTGRRSRPSAESSLAMAVERWMAADFLCTTAGTAAGVICPGISPSARGVKLALPQPSCMAADQEKLQRRPSPRACARARWSRGSMKMNSGTAT